MHCLEGKMVSPIKCNDLGTLGYSAFVSLQGKPMTFPTILIRVFSFVDTQKCFNLVPDSHLFGNSVNMLFITLPCPLILKVTLTLALVVFFCPIHAGSVITIFYSFVSLSWKLQHACWSCLRLTKVKLLWGCWFWDSSGWSKCPLPTQLVFKCLPNAVTEAKSSYSFLTRLQTTVESKAKQQLSGRGSVLWEQSMSLRQQWLPDWETPGKALGSHSCTTWHWERIFGSARGSFCKC